MRRAPIGECQQFAHLFLQTVSKWTDVPLLAGGEPSGQLKESWFDVRCASFNHCKRRIHDSRNTRQLRCSSLPFPSLSLSMLICSKVHSTFTLTSGRSRTILPLSVRLRRKNVLMFRLPARALFPYTTACSPWMISFPGADTVILVPMTAIRLSLSNVQLSVTFAKEQRLTESQLNWAPQKLSIETFWKSNSQYLCSQGECFLLQIIRRQPFDCMNASCCELSIVRSPMAQKDVQRVQRSWAKSKRSFYKQKRPSIVLHRGKQVHLASIREQQQNTHFGEQTSRINVAVWQGWSWKNGRQSSGCSCTSKANIKQTMTTMSFRAREKNSEMWFFTCCVMKDHLSYWRRSM